jgi:hypothetical protein
MSAFWELLAEIVRFRNGYCRWCAFLEFRVGVKDRVDEFLGFGECQVAEELVMSEGE